MLLLNDDAARRPFRQQSFTQTTNPRGGTYESYSHSLRAVPADWRGGADAIAIGSSQLDLWC